ncbi:hypothetical protein ABIA31_008075 [Catenulispora sp. MAP5-51]|uniref:hypothetical protein n=1 Tax=Catenulispora sp. MAP5-51 TaxID=3156298 RepID=UPI003511A114
MTELTGQAQDVAAQTKLISRLRTFGAVLCIAAVIIRTAAFGHDLRLVGDVGVPVTYSWIVFAVLTACHVFLTPFHVHKTHEVWLDLKSGEGATILDVVKREGGIYVSHIEPTLTKRRFRYHRSLWDLSSWTAYFSTVLLVAAVAPWHLDHGHLRWAKTSTTVCLLLVALALAAVNWVAGSTWMVALIELAVPRDQASYHAKLEIREESALHGLRRELLNRCVYGSLLGLLLFVALKLSDVVSWSWWWLSIPLIASMAAIAAAFLAGLAVLS